jgi:hypothetical protein
MNASGNLVDSLLSYNNGAVVQQIAQQLGIPESAARGAIESMAPSLSRGIERNISKPGGLEDLLNAVETGNHQRYVDNPDLLARPETITDGNAILGHILGSKDVSRNVAAFSGQEAGLSDSLLKQMLPMLAAAAMGVLAKQMTDRGRSARVGGGQAGPDIMSMLNSFLDTNKDGSAIDEILSLAQMFFQRR